MYKTYLLLILISALLTGCTGWKDYQEPPVFENENEKPTTTNKKPPKEPEVFTEGSSEQGAVILSYAKLEQQNEMYNPDHDSTFLYWLNNKLLLLDYTTKCNVFALNTLFRAGFKCPNENALTRDLMNTSKYQEIFPIVDISELSEIKKGDLLVWSGHVILFDKLIKVKNDYYAQAWWAGTRQADNGENIINNVIYGKYPLRGNFIVRRPIRRS